MILKLYWITLWRLQLSAVQKYTPLYFLPKATVYKCIFIEHFAV